MTSEESDNINADIWWIVSDKRLTEDTDDGIVDMDYVTDNARKETVLVNGVTTNTTDNNR